MIRPTVSQSIRTRRVIVVWSVRVASQATSASKSQVNPERCRANGTLDPHPVLWALKTPQLGAELEPPNPEIQVAPDRLDRLLVVAMRRGELAQRAPQPSPTKRDPHHDPVAEELNLPDPDPLEVQQARECCADAHLALLCELLTLGTPSSLPPHGGGASPHPDRVSPASMPASDPHTATLAPPQARVSPAPSTPET